MNKTTETFDETQTTKKENRGLQITMIILSAICILSALFFLYASIVLTIDCLTNTKLSIIVYILLLPYWIIGLIFNIVIIVICRRNIKDRIIKWAFYIVLASIIIYLICVVLFYISVNVGN